MDGSWRRKRRTGRTSGKRQSTTRNRRILSSGDDDSQLSWRLRRFEIASVQRARTSVGMALTFCHVVDWHLQRTLRGVSLERAQRRFLRWLANLVVERDVDASLVAGDVFDRSVPAASADESFYSVLAEIAARAPGLTVVVVAGNRDGVVGLSAPASLMRRLGVRVVGALPSRRRFDGRAQLVPETVPIVVRTGDSFI